ncbi:MAG: hypothetical protein ACI4XA_00950 [Oscillospiraceae bacterium]
MKAHKILGILAAIALVIFGLAFPVPEKHLRVSLYSHNNNWMEAGEEYVGGDAYNYQMEASLKAGWVSGVLAVKAICASSGVLLFFLILMSESHEKEVRKQNELLEKVISSQNNLNVGAPNQEPNAAPVPQESQTT